MLAETWLVDSQQKKWCEVPDSEELWHVTNANSGSNGSNARRRDAGTEKVKDQVVWMSAVAIAVSAGMLDWRTRVISNWLTVPAFALGLCFNLFEAGTRGALRSLEGAGAALLLLLPVVLLRGLGGGDWKLMGALGSWLGPDKILVVLLATIFLSGLLALAQVIWKQQLFQTLRNLWELLQGFFVYGLRPHPELNLEDPAASTVPFGVAAAFATVACFWAGVHGG
ncbi:MAG: A24 family peptidase [Candidatus Acidiferrales bacterium]